MQEPTFLTGDVDIRTGDVVAPGDIEVKGDVRAGRALSAAGSVRILGAAEACSISAEGDISIEQGMVGGGRGLIHAGGNVTVGHVHGATVEAGGDILIGSSAMNSNLSSGGDIRLSGQGVLVGGVAMAKGNLYAKLVGHKGVHVWDPQKGRSRRVVQKTVIMLGLDPRTRQQRDKAEERLHPAEEMASESAKNVEYLMDKAELLVSKPVLDKARFLVKTPINESLLTQKGVEAASQMNRELRNLIAGLASGLPSVSERPDATASGVGELCLQLYNLYAANDLVMQYYLTSNRGLAGLELNPNAVLVVSETVYPGVEVTIGFTTAVVEEMMKATRFRLLDDEVVAEPALPGLEGGS